MKNAIALIALSLMTASCVNLQGNLSVHDTMSVKKRGGFLNLQMKTVEIQPGDYAANLKVNNAKSFTLVLKSKKENENDILIPIKKETDFSIPSTGNVIIRGSDISQPFDISGKIETDYNSSDETRTYEACTISRTENHCEKICTAGEVVNAPREERGGRPTPPMPPRQPVCQIACHDVVVSYPGQQYVEYHYLTTTRNLSADLLASDSKAPKASFSGTDTDTTRITDVTGPCR
jgi:hypothetical protein